jgi:hypothetical protein
MSNVDKTVQLILSDDETSQELGFMMAVSQGLKDQVLNVLYSKIAETYIDVMTNSYPLRFQHNGSFIEVVNNIAFKTKLSSNILVYLEFELKDGYKSTSINPKVMNIANKFLSLKNYNYDRI